MKEISNRNFGLIISYIFPGFVTLWGLSHVSLTLANWLGTALSDSEIPTVGGFLYVTLASSVLGMTISAVRWAVIDAINERTGLARPDWDDSKLQKNLTAYQVLVEIHYKYFQFYANMFVAIILAYAVRRWAIGFTSFPDISEALMLVLAWVFWRAQRDALARYYDRVGSMLSLKKRKSP